MLMKTGLLQAVGIAGYVVAVALFMSRANEIFGKMDDKFLGPLLFLSIFIVSAMVCALLMFYSPYQKFLKGKGKEAIQQVVATTAWLGVFLVIVVVLTLISK